MARKKPSTPDAPPPAPPEDSDSTYLGVPDGYVAPITHLPPAMRGVIGAAVTVSGVPQQMAYPTPRYTKDDVLRPTAWPVQDIVGLQQAMVDAGLLSGKYTPGMWDDKSQTAYKNLLEYANQYGYTWNDNAVFDLLGALTATGSGGGGGGGGGGVVRQLANPADIRRLANQVAQSEIGRELLGPEHDVFLQAFREQVEAPQGQTAPPSPETFAEEQVREMHPVEAQAHDLTNTYGMFLNMIGLSRG